MAADVTEAAAVVLCVGVDWHRRPASLLCLSDIQWGRRRRWFSETWWWWRRRRPRTLSCSLLQDVCSQESGSRFALRLLRNFSGL